VAAAPSVALGTDRGDWNVYYLHLHNADYEANRARCPVTTATLAGVPRSYQHAFFSAVAPGTHITPHTGPTNKKLRCHLPLLVPPGGLSRIRVGDETVVFEEGKCFVFDDSFEHEVWNDAGAWRVRPVSPAPQSRCAAHVTRARTCTSQMVRRVRRRVDAISVGMPPPPRPHRDTQGPHVWC
jgi:hypothetical protein